MSVQYLNRICPSCGGNAVVLLANGSVMCEKCHHILSVSTTAFVNFGETYNFDRLELESHTLYIDTKMIKLKQKDLELELEFEVNKLDKINTIVINGYKYVKEDTNG
jgi:ribosomal protein S27AE